MFDPDPQKELTASPTLVALVADRIFSEDAPQGTIAPYVCHWSVDGIRSANLSQPAESKTVRIQIDIFASTKKKARAIRDAVTDAIDNAAQGEVRNDLLLQSGREITRLYQWVVDVEYVVNR
jgi:hypothetical protein